MYISKLDLEKALRVATMEFAQHGFDGMSMRVLANKCSVTAGALYHHFASKEELYEEVCNQIFDDIVCVIEASVTTASTPDQMMERFVLALFDEWMKNNHILVLTQRTVISAMTRPDHCFTVPHFRRLFAAINKIQSKILGTEVDEATSYAFGSMIFGFCSLMRYPMPDSGCSAEAYIAKRRSELLRFSKIFLSATNL